MGSIANGAVMLEILDKKDLTACLSFDRVKISSMASCDSYIFFKLIIDDAFLELAQP